MQRKPVATREQAVGIRNFDEAAKLCELGRTAINAVNVACDISGMKTRSIWIWVAVNEFDQLGCYIPAKLIVNEKVDALTSLHIGPIAVASQWETGHE